ncbi:MAG: cysteine methyltransferase, partial [Oscillospiraceae bacterium]|nr:cysteine methyltransferase [Oscillospiraceae bacterium]
MYYKTAYPTPVGLVTLACDADHLVGLWLEGQKYFGGAVPEEMQEKRNMPVFNATIKWLDRYFAAQKPAKSALSFAPIGSEFRQEGWSILCEIPYGEVMT